MVDPLTALSVASAAVSQMRSLISAGQDATSAMSKFAGAWSDINYAESKAKNVPWWKTFGGSAEKEALEVFAAKRKMAEMKKEVETLISWTYGPSGLEDYKNILREIKEQRRKQEYRKQEVKEAIINWTVGILALITGVAILAGVFYLIGVKQGKW